MPMEKRKSRAVANRLSQTTVAKKIIDKEEHGVKRRVTDE
jgi:hypothetical protein